MQPEGQLAGFGFFISVDLEEARQQRGDQPARGMKRPSGNLECVVRAQEAVIAPGPLLQGLGSARLASLPKHLVALLCLHRRLLASSSFDLCNPPSFGEQLVEWKLRVPLLGGSRSS